MRFLYTAILIPVLGLFAAGCTSTTGLQSSEADDLYYGSSDRTTRVEYAVQPESSGTQTATDEVVNPDYAGSTSSDNNQTSVTNNYNYYDSDYGYSYSRNYRTRSYRSYGYAYDPFYSPFGYSAAYCYGIYDPFYYPGYCPYNGLTISIGYGYGGYGYGYPSYGYGYRPYGYYGGGYYQGFYDGYYAGNGYGNGYGYGYHRNVNYGPRGNRSNVPVNAPTGGSGRPNPNRVADPNQPGRITEGGRPMRDRSAQPGNPGNIAPGREGRPNNVISETQPGINRDQMQARPEQPTRPQRDQNIRPENYQFQPQEQPNQTTQPVIENNRPIRVRDAEMPANQNTRPQNNEIRNEVTPAAQSEQPARPSRREGRSIFQTQPQQQNQSSPENYSRPSRNNSENRSNDGGSRNERPSYQNNSPSGGNSGRPSGGMGRPRN